VESSSSEQPEHSSARSPRRVRLPAVPRTDGRKVTGISSHPRLKSSVSARSQRPARGSAFAVGPSAAGSVPRRWRSLPREQRPGLTPLQSVAVLRPRAPARALASC